MARRRRRFKFADIAQQVVGGFLLAGSFVVTEEVWTLAANMDTPNGVVIAAIVLAIGYGTLYGVDDEHDPDRERDVAGVPARFLSLIGVAFGSVVIPAFVFDAPETVLVETPAEERLVTTLRTISIGAVFRRRRGHRRQRVLRGSIGSGYRCDRTPSCGRSRKDFQPTL